MDAARALPPSPRSHRRPLLKAVAAALLTPPLLFAAALFWPLPAPPPPDVGNSRVIINARVVDVQNGIASAPTTVTVRNGTIIAIGDGPHDATLHVFDAAGIGLLLGV